MCNVYVHRIESGGYYSSSSSSSSSSLCSPHQLLPLIFTNALHVAVDSGSVDVVRLLLKYGLEPNGSGRLPGDALDETQAPPPRTNSSSKPNSPRIVPKTKTSTQGQKDSPPPRKFTFSSSNEQPAVPPPPLPTSTPTHKLPFSSIQTPQCLSKQQQQTTADTTTGKMKIIVCILS